MRKAWVEAAGRNYGGYRMGAPIKIQQRLYKRWLAIPDQYRDEADRLGIEWWNRKLVKGPGVDW